MNCPKCKQAVETGAAFCGNCGQPLEMATSSVALAAAVPSYALAMPSQRAGESRALLSLLLGAAGIIGAPFMALIGLTLGMAGLIAGTIVRSSAKRSLSTAGLVLSSLAILASLATWAYATKHDPALQKTSQTANHNITAPAVSASGVSTSCYSAGFADKFNVSNASGSCDMSAFNGTTMNNSTDAYKVYANNLPATDANSFTSLVKPAIEKDFASNLPGSTITNEQMSQFAGSPAYIVSTFDKKTGVAVVEAAVLHKVGSGENVFILVHAANARSADLTVLEAEWQWK